MHQLLYASSTSRDLPHAMLEDILAVARRNNAQLGVTGMLLHIDGGFMQVLEGEAAVLRPLYDRIAADKRHWQAHVIFDRAAPRIFGNWTMGFRTLERDRAEDAGAFQVTEDAIAHRLAEKAREEAAGHRIEIPGGQLVHIKSFAVCIDCISSHPVPPVN